MSEGKKELWETWIDTGINAMDESIDKFFEWVAKVEAGPLSEKFDLFTDDPETIETFTEVFINNYKDDAAAWEKLKEEWYEVWNEAAFGYSIPSAESGFSEAPISSEASLGDAIIEPPTIVYIPEIQKLINQGGVNAKGQYDTTPLHFAAQKQPEAIKPLIDAGANVNAKNFWGEIPLHYAAGEYPEVIKPLIDAGSNINAKSTYGLTPLHYAAKFQPAAIKPLIDAGANVNAKVNDGTTPLHFAAQFQPEGIKPLIDAGANVNAKNKDGETPFDLAGTEEAKELLKASIVKPDPQIQELIDEGGVNATNEEGTTPLHFAAMQQPEIIPWLVSQGANVNAKNIGGETPLHYAATFNPQSVKPLLDAGANVSAKNKIGNTPLHNAAMYLPDLESIQALLTAIKKTGGNLLEQNNDGKTALEVLDIAEMSEDDEMFAEKMEVKEMLINAVNEYGQFDITILNKPEKVAPYWSADYYHRPLLIKGENIDTIVRIANYFESLIAQYPSLENFVHPFLENQESDFDDDFDRVLIINPGKSPKDNAQAELPQMFKDYAGVYGDTWKLKSQLELELRPPNPYGISMDALPTFPGDMVELYGTPLLIRVDNMAAMRRVGKYLDAHLPPLSWNNVIAMAMTANEFLIEQGLFGPYSEQQFDKVVIILDAKNRDLDEWLELSSAYKSPFKEYVEATVALGPDAGQDDPKAIHIATKLKNAIAKDLGLAIEESLPESLPTTKEPSFDPLIALKEESKEYINQLSEVSKTIVRKYTKDMYTTVNACLRDPDKPKQCLDELVELDRILANGPETKGTIAVFRGFKPHDDGKKLYEKLTTMKPGELFVERAFMSTSYAGPKLKGANCCTMKIELPAGVRALAVEGISYYPDEKEILLAPGMGLRFLKRYNDSKYGDTFELSCEFCLPDQRFIGVPKPHSMMSVPRKMFAELPPVETDIPKTLGTAIASRMRKATARVPPPHRGDQRYIMSMLTEEELSGKMARLYGGDMVVVQFVRRTDESPFQKAGEFAPALFKDRYVDLVINENTSVEDLDEMINNWNEEQLFMVRGFFNDEVERWLTDEGFVSLLPSKYNLMEWFTNDRRFKIDHVREIFDAPNIGAIILDLITPMSFFTPSKRRLPPSLRSLTPASQAIFGSSKNPDKIEKYLGCPLFTTGCVDRYKDEITKKQYDVPEEFHPKMMILGQHIVTALGRHVMSKVLPSLGQKFPYLVSGTIALNYWIQNQREGMPIIPTLDWDLKLPMKHSSAFKTAIEKQLESSRAAIVSEVKRNLGPTLTIRDIRFEWIEKYKDELITLLAIVELEEPVMMQHFGALTPLKEINFAVIDLSHHTGIDRVEDWRYKTPGGIFLASPQYIKRDICKTWGQCYKKKRRQAKYEFWNTVFPRLHPYHQDKPFDCDAKCK